MNSIAVRDWSTAFSSIVLASDPASLLTRALA
jgi:hypothetical protein